MEIGVTKSGKLFNSLFMCIGYAVLGLMIYSFIMAPFTGDLQVFFAAANQVKYKEVGGILAVFEAWELKGIGNRLLMFTIYKITTLFVSYSNVVMFTTLSKTIYSVLVMLILGVAVYLLPIEKKQKLQNYMIVLISVFATFTAVQMQTEMTCVILCFVCFACLLHGKTWSIILSGMIGASLFFFKSIFILLYVVVLLAVIIFHLPELKIQVYLKSAISMIVSLCVFSFIVLSIYPQEFVDMAAAAEWQSTLLSLGSKITLNAILDSLFNGLIESVVSIPFTILGILSFVLLICEYIKERKWVALVSLCFMQLIIVDLIVLSNMYFVYHYYLFTFPSIICVIMLLQRIRMEKWISIGGVIIAAVITVVFTLINNEENPIGIVNYSTVLLVIIHLIILSIVIHNIIEFEKLKTINYIIVITVCCFFWMNYSSVISDKYDNMIALRKVAIETFNNAVPEDFNKEEVLFLDGGDVSFYVDAPSYSRYFLNLPLQRWSPGDEWEIQKDEYNKLMDYKGKYIVYCSWFGLEKYPELLKKINTEYVRLENGGLYTHSPNWDLFAIDTVPDVTETNITNYELCIYVRK